MTWEVLHRWWMPFAWITLCSVAGVPLAIYLEHGMAMHSGSELGLAYGDAWVQRTDLLAALMPYLLNLAAAGWFFSENGSTRWAAFWATLIGLARVIAPVALAMLSDVSLASNTQHYVDWSTVRWVLWFQDFEMLVFGAAIWAVFARFVGAAGGTTAPAAHYAEA